LSFAANLFILMILYGFCLLPAQFCYNRIHTEGWKPCANRTPVCTSENFHIEAFYMIHNGAVPSVQCDMNLRRSPSMREADRPSFIFPDFDVPALAPRLNWIQTALQLSEDSLRDPCHTQVSSATRSR
jgi:hypothetical protein